MSQFGITTQSGAGAGVKSINGRVGDVLIGKSDIGLANVEDGAAVRTVNGAKGDITVNKAGLGLDQVENAHQLKRAENLADLPDRAGAQCNLGAGRAFNTVAEMTTLVSPKNGEVVHCRGYHTTGGGGGGSFQYVSGDETTPVDNGLVFTTSSGGRLMRIRTRPVFDVKEFGARGDGSTNDTAAIQAAIAAAVAAGGGDVLFPQGVYVILSDLTLANNVNIIGEGQPTLDFRTATLTTAGIVLAGSLGALAELSGDVAAGAQTFTLASAPSVVAGDVIVLFQPGTSSYSSYRTYYYQGEFVQVSAVSGATVTAAQRLFSAYTVVGSDVYKLNSVKTAIRGLRLLGKAGTNLPIIKVSFGRACVFEDLEMSGSPYTQLALDRCYETACTRVVARDYGAAVGLNYGIIIGNCQRITLTDCFLCTTRHGLTLGGGDFPGAVPCREITVTGGTIASSGGLYGFYCHGNSERCVFSNVSFPNGAVTGGDHFSFTGCEFRNDNNDGYAFSDGAEPTGANVLFLGNRVTACRNFNEGLVRYSIYPGVVAGSVLTFLNNNINTGTFGRADYPTNPTDVVRVLTMSGGQTDVTAVMAGNAITTSATTAGHYSGLKVSLPFSANGIKNVKIHGNSLEGCGISVDGNAALVSILHNTVRGSLGRGIRIPWVNTPALTSQLIEICGNRVTECHSAGIDLTPDTLAIVVMKDNTSLSNAKTVAGNAYDTSCYIGQGGQLLIEQNIFGDLASPVKQTTAYVVSGTTLVRRNNQILGTVTSVTASGTPDVTMASNGLLFNDSTYGQRADGNARFDPSTKSLLIGGGTGTTGIANYLVRAIETANATLYFQLVNEAAAGNASAGAAYHVGVADASGYLGVYTNDHANTDFKRRLVLGANSTALGITIAAETGGQNVKVRTEDGDAINATAAGVAIKKLSINGMTTGSTVGAAGGASALPATPAGYVTVNINGNDYKMPYFLT
jgi:hypothetical protein